MPQTISTYRLLASVARMLLCIVFAGSGAPALAAEPLVIALAKTPLSLPFYVAQAEGFFASEGLTVTINDVIGGHRTMQQLLDGQADVATSSEAVVMFNSFKRDDFYVIASFARSKEDVKVITLQDSGITKSDQLRNKRVGTIVGSASNYYVDTLALLHGVDPKSIQLVNLQPEAMASALKSRQVDAISVWQPHAYDTQSQLKDAQALHDGGFYTLSFNIVVPRKHLKTRATDWNKMLSALARAQSLIASDPAKAKGILRNRLQIDANYIEWLWPRYRYQLALDQSLLTTLESEARWARSEGLVPSRSLPNYLEFIHSAPLRSLRASAVSITE